jgi:hypothetical protein
MLIIGLGREKDKKRGRGTGREGKNIRKKHGYGKDNLKGGCLGGGGGFRTNM